MRTTIDISDGLLKRARKKADLDGITLSELVEKSLRQALDAPKVGPRKPFKLVTFAGGGLKPGFTWEKLGSQSLTYKDLTMPLMKAADGDMVE